MEEGGGRGGGGGGRGGGGGGRRRGGRGRGGGLVHGAGRGRGGGLVHGAGHGGVGDYGVVDRPDRHAPAGFEEACRACGKNTRAIHRHCPLTCPLRVHVLDREGAVRDVDEIFTLAGAKKHLQRVRVDRREEAAGNLVQDAVNLILNPILCNSGLIAQRDAVIAERDAVIAERDAMIAERDGIIAQLNQQVQVYRGILDEANFVLYSNGLGQYPHPPAPNLGNLAMDMDNPFADDPLDDPLDDLMNNFADP